MFCKKCGADMKDSPKCPLCIENSNESTPCTSQTAGASLPENVAGMLCYLLGWLTGLIFIFIDRRPSVKFHAMQSIVTFGGLSVLTFVYNKIISIFPIFLWRILSSVNALVSLGSLLLAIFLMIQAYNGKQYKVPFVAPYAEQLTDKFNFKA